MSIVDIEYQLAPPYSHRRHYADRAIRTLKNHSVAVLCSTNKDFPPHLWDRLLQQALLALNLLQSSYIKRELFAQAQLHGAFNCNRTPLATPGTRVLVDEKPTARGT
jgi:hypothetical protein